MQGTAEAMPEHTTNPLQAQDPWAGSLEASGDGNTRPPSNESVSRGTIKSASQTTSPTP